MRLIRYLKYLFLIVVALALILMAFANSGMVTVELIPADLSVWVGFQYSVTLPLYVVILSGVVVGLLVGFVWEWLREHRHRAEAKTQRRTAKQLEREIQSLKGSRSEGQDDILALIEGPGSAR